MAPRRDVGPRSSTRGHRYREIDARS